jgi:hypothetical protein
MLMASRAAAETELTTPKFRMVGNPEVIRFIRHAARWRRF